MVFTFVSFGFDVLAFVGFWRMSRLPAWFRFACQTERRTSARVVHLVFDVCLFSEKGPRPSHWGDVWATFEPLGYFPARCDHQNSPFVRFQVVWFWLFESLQQFSGLFVCQCSGWHDVLRMTACCAAMEFLRRSLCAMLLAFMVQRIRGCENRKRLVELCSYAPLW